MPTHIGNYVRGRVIVMKKEDVKYMYIITKTKGSMSSMDLSAIERTTIDCVEKLFNSIPSANVKYHKLAFYLYTWFWYECKVFLFVY